MTIPAMLAGRRTERCIERTDDVNDPASIGKRDLLITGSVRRGAGAIRHGSQIE